MFRLSSVILALVIAIACANADEELEKIYVKSLESCADKTKITKEQLEDIGNMNVPTDKAPMCFLACMAKSIEIMDSNNKFSKNAFKKLMDVDMDKIHEEARALKLIETVNKCIDEQPEEKDECVAATNGWKCLVTNAEKDDLRK